MTYYCSWIEMKTMSHWFVLVAFMLCLCRKMFSAWLSQCWHWQSFFQLFLHFCAEVALDPKLLLMKYIFGWTLLAIFVMIAVICNGDERFCKTIWNKIDKKLRRWWLHLISGSQGGEGRNDTSQSTWFFLYYITLETLDFLFTNQKQTWLLNYQICKIQIKT